MRSPPASLATARPASGSATRATATTPSTDRAKADQMRTPGMLVGGSDGSPGAGVETEQPRPVRPEHPTQPVVAEVEADQRVELGRVRVGDVGEVGPEHHPVAQVGEPA